MITKRLDDLERRIETAREALATFAVAEDRTWPWPLHETSALSALVADID